MIVPFQPGTDVVEGRRIRSKHEKFVFSTFGRATGQTPQQLLGRIFRGARIVVDANENDGPVRGWAMAEAGRDPFVFVCRPWLGTPIGEHIRGELLQALRFLSLPDMEQATQRLFAPGLAALAGVKPE